MAARTVTASAALAAAFLAILAPGPVAWAAGPHAADAAPPDAVDETLPAVSGAPLTLEDLEGATAGAAVSANVFSNQQLTATNSGNSVIADTVKSGDIALSDSAFSGFNGVGNFVFNTGANNNLQGLVSVNIISVPEF